MARGRPKTDKAKQRSQRAKTLTADKFRSFVADVVAHRQELDDSSMAHAAAFKKADALGVHPAASKLYMRLDKMEPSKRTDFLRSFDQYRQWANGWDEQPDLLDEAEQAPVEASDTQTDEPGADEAQEGKGEGAEPTEEIERAAAERAPEVEADLGEEGSLDPTEDLQNAGYTFEAGREAGVAGTSSFDNPHAPTHASAPIWERGRAQGERERNAPPEPAEDSKVTELKSRRGRRAASADDHAALVH